ncbi:ABC transporter permease [Elstera cyanobacteriorum]|uniref:Sugar ABC transporter permease YjfF n=1 Tax=Elstera cyanobacteriorum TaxID=2022747 RepID=A0A255XR39_9PROT|nr:galactofuranose ABC transporter, permease protein YjfF [Elstera cyanobacteriorum]OYQ19438.1 sugar ABC transporter permease YjfF [Elstera cyanobacteriorum]GFZ91463.1 ABC transporter permease [Elstera cyanobacteriorum]
MLKNERLIPLAATLLVFLLLYGLGMVQYRNFASTLVLGNLLTDNAFLITAAIGMTFVILSGGIDLSVGSMIAFVGVGFALLVTQAGWHPLAAAGAALVFGVAFGAAMGWLIEAFDIQPFIVTLAGMFLLRGLAFGLTLESIAIQHPFIDMLAGVRVPLPGRGGLTVGALIMLAALAGGLILAHWTRFGSNVYALGGDRTSAVLLGVPVRRTVIGIYALSGFYSSLAGILYTLYTASGYPLAAVGVELDAIAAVVIGGTLLTGGVGYLLGTLFGGLIQGVIQTLIAFDGSLNSWWTKIAVGGLLFAFIVFQRGIARSFASLRRGAA